MAKFISARGLSAEIVGLEGGISSPEGLAVIRTRNQYLGATYAAVFRRAVNQAHAIYNALNRLYWLPKFGPPFMAFVEEDAVEKVEFGPPWLLATAWRLGLDSIVTSVEGAKSVVEHRSYMRNPLAKASVVMPKPREVKRVFAVAGMSDGIVDELLRATGLRYAEVALGVYEDGERVIDVDPIPELDEARARLLAEFLASET